MAGTFTECQNNFWLPFERRFEGTQFWGRDVGGAPDFQTSFAGFPGSQRKKSCFQTRPCVAAHSSAMATWLGAQQSCALGKLRQHPSSPSLRTVAESATLSKKDGSAQDPFQRNEPSESASMSLRCTPFMFSADIIDATSVRAIVPRS